MSGTTAIAPTIGRKLWLFISPEDRRHDWSKVVVLDHTQPLDASVAFVHPPEKHPEFTYVTVTFADHEGRIHDGKVVPLRQPGQKHPEAREWVEWMPFQQGQAKAAQAPTQEELQQRNNLEYALVSGAAAMVAANPARASDIAGGIRALLEGLQAQAPAASQA